jgi:hypothetical protein
MLGLGLETLLQMCYVTLIARHFSSVAPHYTLVGLFLYRSTLTNLLQRQFPKNHRVIWQLHH